MADTLYRQWLLLKWLPRGTRRISVKELHERLAREGIDVSLRGVQRDLIDLQRSFPIETDGGKPAGWSWTKTAETTLMPGMEPSTALAMRVVEEHTRHLLPKSSLKALQPHFKMARTALAALKGPGKGAATPSWLERVRVVPRSYPLQAPDVKQAVTDAVYDAVFDNRQLEVSYTARASTDEKKLTLHPLGLVFKDSLVFLLATANDYQDVRQYAVHRFKDAKVTKRPAAMNAKSFDIDRYIGDGELQRLKSKKARRLKALFHPDAAPTVLETPIAKDQVATVQKDGWVKVEAVVADSLQLEAFLNSFGKSCKVIDK